MVLPRKFCFWERARLACLVGALADHISKGNNNFAEGAEINTRGRVRSPEITLLSVL
jgi:hypothetical protein